jgi:integrase
MNHTLDRLADVPTVELVQSVLEPVQQPPKSRAAVRGNGRIFQRGRRYWIAYYRRKDGKSTEVREAAGTTEQQARKLLKQRQDELAAHRLGIRRFQGPQQERVMVTQLLDELERDYALRGLASTDRVHSHLKHIRAYFGNDRALEVTPARVNAYMEMRIKERAENATVNREVKALQRAFVLAVEQEVLTATPKFKCLPENNAAKGFFERADFEAILPRLTMRGNVDTDLQDFVTWAYYTGMRSGESKSLTWADFDAGGWTLRLHGQDAKNGHGRTIPLENELRAVMERRITARRLECPYIFHRNGKRMGAFRKVWDRACKELGLHTQVWNERKQAMMLVRPRVHDFRRSFVRNMVRAGVSEKTAMAISGHRTRAVFDRYNIVNEADLRQAVKQNSDYLSSLPTKSNLLKMVQ